MTTHTLALNVAKDHPAYAGHFPGQPILPGVVLLDETLRALATALGLPAASTHIQSAKFLSPVLPGEPLQLGYAATPAGAFRFELTASGRAVANGVLTFSQTDEAAP